MQKASVLATCLAGLLTSCGASNFNKIFENSQQTDTIDQLLNNAEYAYDQGEFEKALSLAKKAHEMNPGERSSIVMGYANLSLAGLDAFQLTKRMTEEQNESNTGESQTSKLFSLLAAAMGISDEDFEAMSVKAFEGDPVVYEPKAASVAREGGVSSIKFFSDAIESLCPFIAEAARQESDSRHNCTPSEDSSNLGSATFAWALAHLGEAITFYSLIFYTSEGQTKPNLVARAEALSQFKSNPVTYLAKITELTDIIETILPTDAAKAEDSMLNAIFSDLQSTNLALEASGAPKSVTKSVTKVITEIQGSITDFSNVTESNQAIKNKFTKSISKSIASQINDLNTDGVDQDQLCAAFQGINSDAANLPDACK
jgi:tetratricopeptide (TPR) repeat protein